MVGAQFARNLVHRRNLLQQLVERDFRQRHIGSAAGWLWGLVHPLVMLASWTFVFQYCLRSPMPEGSLTQNYTLFLLCGYLPWMLFQEAVQRSANTLLDNSNLITKTLFPSEMLPVSVFLSSAINHAFGVGMALVAVAFWERHWSVWVLLLPVYTLLLGLLAVGFGWIFSSLQVYLRDTAQGLMVLLTLWFWVTPIFISAEQIPENFRFLLQANPLSLFVKAYRERLLSDRVPDLQELGLMLAWSVAVFVVGGLVFRQLKRGFADVL